MCLSRLAETEFYAALALKKRTKELHQSDITAATTLFEQHINQLVYERIYITDRVFQSAIKFLANGNTSLRTLDALHLACSSIINSNFRNRRQNFSEAKELQLSFCLL